jgi:hypothetical protein
MIKCDASWKTTVFDNFKERGEKCTLSTAVVNRYRYMYVSARWRPKIGRRKNTFKNEPTQQHP